MGRIFVSGLPALLISMAVFLVILFLLINLFIFILPVILVIVVLFYLFRRKIMKWFISRLFRKATKSKTQKVDKGTIDVKYKVKT